MDEHSEDKKECVAYSSKYNLEFYCIPKNGITAITNYLQIFNINRKCISKIPKVFCVIRNPITRLVSSFYFLKNIYNSNQNNFSSLVTLNEYKYKSFYNLNVEQGFENYINEIVTNGPFDLHHKCQTDFMTMNFEPEYPHPYNTMVRDIGKITHYIDFDNLEKDIGKMIDDEDFKMQYKFNSTNQEKEVDQLKQIAYKKYNDIYSAYMNDFLIYESIKTLY